MRRLTTMATAAAALGIFAAQASAQSIQIRYGDHVPTVHYASTDGATYWFERVKELTNDEVDFTYFPAEQASKARQMLDAVDGGLLDCAYVGAIYIAEELPINTIFGLPGFITDAASGTAVYQQLLAEDTPFRREWLENGVTPVWGMLQPPNQVFKRGEPIDSIEDWEGLKVRVSGDSVALAVDMLGGVPVRFAAPEMYMGLERGTLDVSLLPFATAKGYRINEVSQSASTNMSLGSWNVTIACATEKWESWPEEVREAMLQAGEETAQHLAELYDGIHNELVETWSAEGLETFEADPELLDAMNEVIEPVAEDWVMRMSAVSKEADEAMELYRSMMAETD